MLELLEELLKYSRFFLGYKRSFIASTTNAIILEQLCHSENKILLKFIDMTSADNLIPKQKTSMSS